ncbi:MAG: hypothetical protein JWQ64_1911 [Subtercola sp.]|jgi:hypothetical protein|nr:hypothetical protein [Subtercola sp.]
MTISPRSSIADPGQPGGLPDGGGTATLERELEEMLEAEQFEPGDHERFSHYVQKEKILESAMTGTPVKALCGKKWVPGRDPDKFPVCPTCKEIYEKMQEE